VIGAFSFNTIPASTRVARNEAAKETIRVRSHFFLELILRLSRSGFVYPARKNLILDAGFDHGLTSSSTEWETFAAPTHLLPYRLWGFHNPK
jgi:hypothetical protein